MLKHQRALHVAIAVEAGRKNEVSFQEGRMLAKDIENFVFRHDF